MNNAKEGTEEMEKAAKSLGLMLEAWRRARGDDKHARQSCFSSICLPHKSNIEVEDKPP